MATISTLVVALTGNTTGLERSLKSVESSLNRTAAKIGSVGKTMTAGLTLPIVGLGTAAVTMASQFEDAMAPLNGVIGLSTKQTDALKKSVLGLAGQTAQSPNDLAKALVQIESSGLRGQQAMDVLRVSAKAAAIGLGDVGQIAQFVSSAMNVYGPSTLTAARATTLLMDAARVGNTTVGDLTGTMGPLLPLANHLGISFDQLAATVASVTRNGLQAQSAVMPLETVLSVLEKPTTAATAGLAQVGLSAAGLRSEIASNGLLAALDDLKKGFAENETAMTQVFPSARTMAGIFAILGSNSKQTADVFKTLSNATEGDLNRAFSTAANTAGFKFKQAMIDIQVLLIQIGDQIMPAILPAVQAFAAVVENLSARFATLTPQTRDLILVLAGTAAAVGPMLVGFSMMYSSISTVIGVFRLFVAGWGSVASTIVEGAALITGPGLLAFALMAAAAILIINRWDELKMDLGIIFNWIVDSVRDSFMGKIIDYISKFASYAASELKRFGISIGSDITPALQSMASSVETAGEKLESGFGGAFDEVLGKAKAWAAGMVSAAKIGSAAVVAAAETVQASASQTAAAVGGATSGSVTLWQSLSDSVKSNGPLVQSAFASLKQEALDAANNFNKSMTSMISSTESTMGKMAAAFAQGKETLQTFITQMIQQIANLIIKILVLRALTSAGLGGGFATGFVGGLNFFAAGGRPDPGQISVVGEKGPELFVPDTAGTVVPISQNGGAGGPTVIVNNNLSVAGMDLSSQPAAQQVIKGLSNQLKSSTSDAITFALRSQTLATNHAGRAS